jgi:hypothetical protein
MRAAPISSSHAQPRAAPTRLSLSSHLGGAHNAGTTPACASQSRDSRPAGAHRFAFQPPQLGRVQRNQHVRLHPAAAASPPAPRRRARPRPARAPTLRRRPARATSLPGAGTQGFNQSKRCTVARVCKSTGRGPPRGGSGRRRGTHWVWPGQPEGSAAFWQSTRGGRRDQLSSAGGCASAGRLAAPLRRGCGVGVVENGGARQATDAGRAARQPAMAGCALALSAAARGAPEGRGSPPRRAPPWPPRGARLGRRGAGRGGRWVREWPSSVAWAAAHCRPRSCRSCCAQPAAVRSPGLWAPRMVGPKDTMSTSPSTLPSTPHSWRGGRGGVGVGAGGGWVQGQRRGQGA